MSSSSSLLRVILVWIQMMMMAGILMAISVAAENSNRNNNQHEDNRHDPIILQYYGGEQTQQPELVRYDSPWELDQERHDPASTPSSLQHYYTPELRHVLRQYRQHFAHPLDEAAWLVDLGAAHRDVLLEASEEPHHSNNNDDDDDDIREHERRAILAHQAAIQIYQGWILDHGDDDEVNEDATPQTQRPQQHHVHSHPDDPEYSYDMVQHELASAFFGLAELYRNSLTTTTGNSESFSHDYYNQAYRLWERLLKQPPQSQQWSVDNRRTVQLSVAFCALHLGVALLEQSSSNGNTNFATEDLLSQIFLWMTTAATAAAASSSSDDSALWDLTESWMSGSSSSTGTLTTMEELQRLLEQLSRSNSDISIQIDHLVQAYERQWQLLQRAERFLLQAVDMFRQNIHEDESDALASALQHAGTVAATLGHGMDAIARYQEALDLWHYNRDDDDDDEVTTTTTRTTTRVQAVAQVLLALSDTYLQWNKYDEAHDRYQKAMKWHERYNLDPPPSTTTSGSSTKSSTGGSNAEAIAALEQALQEYDEMFRGDGYADTDETTRGYFDEDQQQEYYSYYERDNGYEADLHASFGALLLDKSNDDSPGDSIGAATHLLEAERLYRLTGESDNVNMASVKFTLAALHLQNGEYPESARLHGEALTIFRQVQGDGEDPMDGGTTTSGLGLEEITAMLLQIQQKQQPNSQQQKQQPSADAKRQDTVTESSQSSPEEGQPHKGGGAKTVQVHPGDASMWIDIEGFLRQNDTTLKDEL